jgi:cell fate regulator YaaT (PSP1 superfamily)
MNSRDTIMTDTPDTAPAEQEHPSEEVAEEQADLQSGPEQAESCYSIQFRPGQQLVSAVSRNKNFNTGEMAMAQTDHGLEPAFVRAKTLPCPGRSEPERLGTFLLVRQTNRDEAEKFNRLLEREQEAFAVCRRCIEKHQLPMKLLRVERFFNGSKIIFYFTAETRVDFRELVKDLVQEFRTRVEIRQVGVRHETKMIGGLGCCGRELCCSGHLKNFAPVSINMAKEQGLPLNPAKISGICNRLLCCLTYEFDTYHALRKKMPKPGKTIILGEKNYKVLKVNALAGTIEVTCLDDKERNITLSREEWERAKKPQPPPPVQTGEVGGKRKKSPKPNQTS